MFRRSLIILTTLCTLCCSREGKLSVENRVIYCPKYATGFEIVSNGADTILQIKNPFQSDAEFSQQVALYRSKKDRQWSGSAIKVPVQSVAMASSSYVAMAEKIGYENIITSISGCKFINSPKIQERIKEGKIGEIGFGGNFDYEVLKSRKTDLVLLYGLYGVQNQITDFLTTLGINYLYIGDYVEQKPLGKAEWIIAIAALCGDIEKGVEFFNEIEQRYNDLKKSVKVVSRPRVMVNTPYEDVWFMPSVNSYSVVLIEDAGGEYLYPQNTSTTSASISLEQALLLTTKADYWINVGQCSSMAELKAQNPKFSTTPVVLNGRVYNNNAIITSSGGSDFWESGCTCPDVVLQDLINIFSGNDSSLHYYKKLE